MQLTGLSMSDQSTGPVRLNKYIAQCGVASRRGADALIHEGRVRVNGAPAESGVKVEPGKDRVELDGKPMVLPAASPRTFLLNKPVQTVTTAHDPQKRTTVLDLLPPDIRKLRPFPVGRLDFFSEGLLLITTDGELCNRLTHPRHHLEKEYRVQVKEKVSEKALSTMRSGMTLTEGDKLAPVRVEAMAGFRGSTILAMTLTQGINRQIRRMCRDLGLTITQLKRVRQGPITLEGLEPGSFRELTDKETTALQHAAGLR